MSILNRNPKSTNLFFHFVPNTNESKSLKLSDSVENTKSLEQVDINLNKVIIIPLFFILQINASFLVD